MQQQLRLPGTEERRQTSDCGGGFLAARKRWPFFRHYSYGGNPVTAWRQQGLKNRCRFHLLVFTTTSTDHALEGFQVRAAALSGPGLFRNDFLPCSTG